MSADKAIIDRRVYYMSRINHWQNRITQLQDECVHTHVVGVAKGNTGNYCEADDSYYVLAQCYNCGKRFHADSERDKTLYRWLLDNMIKVK